MDYIVHREISPFYREPINFLPARQTGVRGKAPKCLQRGKATLSLFQNLRNVQAKQRALSKTSCNVYDMLRKYHHHHSSFWHLLYDNNQ